MASESKSGSYFKPATVEAAGVYFQPSRSKSKRSRNQRAQYKHRRRLEQSQPGCDAGGRSGGTIGLRREEPPGWQQREGCKCALHYGGTCSDFVRNATDKPRRKKVRTTVPKEQLRCYRCNRIGHYARDCYECRYDATRKRARVEYAQDKEKIYITVNRKDTATVSYSSDESDDKLVIDEAQPQSSDAEENWDEPCYIGSPESQEEGGPGDQELEGYDVRSEAEMSEGGSEGSLPLDTSDEENATEQSQPLPQPKEAPVPVPVRRLPSPDSIIKMMKEGEERLRRELAKRAAARREEEQQRMEERRSEQLPYVAPQCAVLLQPRFPTKGIATASVKQSEEVVNQRVTRSQAMRMPQLDQMSIQPQPLSDQQGSTMYDRLIRTIERARSEIERTPSGSGEQR